MRRQPLELATFLFFKSLVGISCAVLPVALAEAILRTFLNHDVFNYDTESWQSLRSDSLISMVFMPFLSLGVLYVVRQNHLGVACRLKEGIHLVASKALPLLAAIIVASLLIGLGILALVIPGFYLLGKYFLIEPIVAFERPGLIQTREYSGELMEGRKLSTLIIAGLLFALWLVAYTATFFGVYVVFPDATIWTNALIDTAFAVPFAFFSVYSFAIYAVATEEKNRVCSPGQGRGCC
jgi:hypothetical protein